MRQVVETKRLWAQADKAAALQELHEKTMLETVLEKFPGARVVLKLQDSVVVEIKEAK